MFTLPAFVLNSRILFWLAKNASLANGKMFFGAVRYVQSTAGIDHAKEQPFKGNQLKIESAFQVFPELEEG